MFKLEVDEQADRIAISIANEHIRRRDMAVILPKKLKQIIAALFKKFLVTIYIEFIAP